MHEKDLLENILTAEVLILARAMKREKRDQGITTTSDFFDEAIAEIGQKKAKTLERLLKQ